MLAAAVVAIMFAAGPQQAEARPNFPGAFAKQYPALKAQVSKVKCGVCHPVKDKKKRNNYGMALRKALGAKKVKDKAKLAAALTKTEKEKSATKDMTFGDLIKAGKLPGVNKK
jgi:hypothetical protein